MVAPRRDAASRALSRITWVFFDLSDCLMLRSYLRGRTSVRRLRLVVSEGHLSGHGVVSYGADKNGKEVIYSYQESKRTNTKKNCRR